MTEFKSYAIIFCVSLIISSVAFFIVPEGEAKKVYGYIISIFVLLVIFSPMMNAEFSLLQDDFPEADYEVTDEEFSESFYDYIYIQSLEITEKLIRAELDGICKNEYGVSISFSDKGDSQFNLASICIKTSTDDLRYSLLIKNKIGNLTGVIPEVKAYEY